MQNWAAATEMLSRVMRLRGLMHVFLNSRRLFPLAGKSERFMQTDVEF